MAEEPITTTETQKHGKIRLTKPTKRQVYRFLLNLLFIVVGNAIAAGASAFFIVPNNFVMGGTTGLGIFVRNLLTDYTSVSETWTDWAVDITVYTANILLYVAGVLILGKKFALATGAGTFLYPAFLTIYRYPQEAYLNAYGHNIACGGEFGSPLFAMLCGATLFGLGIGLVLRVGASTGGTDIPPLIFKKYFGAPVSVTMWLIDIGIIVLQIVKKSLENVLCGVLIAIIASIMIDIVSPIGMKKTQVKIVSKKYREIREMILNELKRGVTVLNGQTGYLKEKCFVILTIVSNRELVKLKEEVQRIDPEAFMTISTVSEVRGRGFSSEGIALPKEAEVLEDLEEVGVD